MQTTETSARLLPAIYGRLAVHLPAFCCCVTISAGLSRSGASPGMGGIIEPKSGQSCNGRADRRFLCSAIAKPSKFQLTPEPLLCQTCFAVQLVAISNFVVPSSFLLKVHRPCTAAETGFSQRETLSPRSRQACCPTPRLELSRAVAHASCF